MNLSMIPLLSAAIAVVPPSRDIPSNIAVSPLIAPQLITAIVILVALCTGLAIIIVVLVKYCSGNDIGMSGLIMFIIGFILIAGSIFKTISVSLGGEGINIKIEQLMKTTKQIQDYLEFQKQQEKEKSIQQYLD